jgi:hypothetical protein
MAIKYSPTEERLLELLPRDGKHITTKQLTAKFYKGRIAPYHAQVYVGNAMRTLIDKTTKNREKFKLKRQGTREIQFWIEQ